MILADTSVWIDHLRKGSGRLQRLLLDDQVTCHPFVIGELACGNLRRRGEILDLLHRLPGVLKVTDAETLYMVDEHQLMGRGLGWVDMHLLASCLTTGARLWTRDRRLAEAAELLGVAAAG